MSERRVGSEPSGYAIGYGQGKGTFRVYFSAFFAIAFIAVAWQTGNGIALAVAAAFVVATFYFYPLIERDRARLGANEYGIFVEGFGLIAWRGVKELRLARRAIRNIVVTELEITLSRDIGGAVMADWRHLPWHRLLMRLPWRMPNDATVLIDLEPFDGDPDEILAEFKRRWRYFG